LNNSEISNKKEKREKNKGEIGCVSVILSKGQGNALQH
jgi:hypothetical protein